MEILKILLKIKDCKNPFAPTSPALVDNLGISKFRMECHSSKINRFGKYVFLHSISQNMLYCHIFKEIFCD